MKSENCISQTGRMPTTAAPIAQPMIPDSASGVSMTRSAPNSSNRPSVTLNAPPKTPMSSPIISTRSSRRISVRRPSEIALQVGHLAHERCPLHGAAPSSSRISGASRG